MPILSASAASQPQTQSSGKNVLRETLLEIGAYVQDYLKDRGDLARQRLKDNLDPPEPDSWHMPVMDIPFGETSPFVWAHFQKSVQRELRRKAELYSYCYRWKLELINRADTYSMTDAIIDYYGYGKNQLQQVVEELIEDTRKLPCDNP